jgi:hypothetical protein
VMFSFVLVHCFVLCGDIVFAVFINAIMINIFRFLELVPNMLFFVSLWAQHFQMLTLLILLTVDTYC